jgi:hypothetical protein
LFSTSAVAVFCRNDSRSSLRSRALSSAVARCCCRASFSSFVSRATLVSSRAADELLGSSTFDVTRLLRATVLRRCTLIGSPPAVERRRIVAPRLRTRHRGDVRLARWSMVRHNLRGPVFARVLKTRSVSKTEQILPIYLQKPTSKVNSPAGPAATAADRAAGDDRRCSWHHGDVKLAANPSGDPSIPSTFYP